MSPKLIIAPLALLSVVALSVGGGPHLQKAEASSLTSVSATRRTVSQYVSLAGTVASINQIALSYDGPTTTVSTVSVGVGDHVNAGQSLAKLANGDTLNTPLTGTVVAVNLSSGDLVPNSSSTTPVSSTSSSASVRGSSFGGHFGFGGKSAPNTNQVQPAASPTPLSITVANTQDVSINATASEWVVGKLHAGQAVTIDIPGEPGIPYRGIVSSVSLDGDASGSTSTTTSPSYVVGIHFTQMSDKPLPMLGMSADLSVHVASQTGVAVPIAAIKETPRGNVVSLGNGHQRVVHLGLIGINYVVVTSGISAGQTVVLPKRATTITTTAHTVRVEVIPSFGRFSGGAGRFNGRGLGGGFQ